MDKHVAKIKDLLSRPLTPEEIAEGNEWMRQVEEGSKHLQGKTHTEVHFGMNVIHGTGKYPPVDDTPAPERPEPPPKRKKGK